MARPFAIWLLPQLAERDVIEQRILTLAKEYGGAFFPAHLTLFSGKTSDLGRVDQVLRELATNQEPLDLGVEGLFTSEMFFKTLYLAIQNSPRLRSFFERLRQALDPESTYVLKPHLSLLYAHLGGPELSRLMNGSELEALAYPFTEAQVAYPEGPDYLWSKLDSWRVFNPVALQGPALPRA